MQVAFNTDKISYEAVLAAFKFLNQALRLLSVFFLVTLFYSTHSSVSFAADASSSSNPKAMLILDGSGSMWGKIKDGHKILVARKAIAGAIRPFEGKLDLGLMSFGHRKRAACLDIQLLKQPTSLNPLLYSRIVNRIKPIGKTPITSSLSSAVKILNRKGAEGASIILLADGPENCRKDPCTLLTPEFAKNNKLTVHVIAFSMLAKDAQSLRCLSENSGGSFHTPSDRETLEVALSSALGTSLKGARPLTPVAKKQQPKKVTIKPGIFLSAHLGETSDALKTGVNWKIEKLNTEGVAEADLPPWTSEKAKAEFDLSPGAYRIVADFDEYQVIRDIDIQKNKRDQERFIFNLSQLKLPARWTSPDSRSGFGKLLLEKQLEKKEKNSVQTSSQEISGQETSGETMLIDLTNSDKIRLIPAGTYKISGIDNGKMQNWFLHAAPGKVIQIPIWKKTGRFRLNLQSASKNNSLSAPFVKIYRTDLRTDKLIEVARSKAKSPQFDLNPGKYLAHIQDGYAETRHSFSIQAAQVLTHDIALEQGFLKIELNGTNGKNKSETPLLEILRLKEKSSPKHVAELSDFSKPIKLSPGAYRLIFRTSATARARIKDVQIKNAAQRVVKFSTRQALVSFLISNRNDALSRHQIFWQLFDRKGQMIWQSAEPTPNLYLSAGQYKIVAEIGNDQYQSKFRIKGLKTKKFDLSNKQIN